MKTGFYAGSFDPFTNGHLHVITTASRLFDKVIIGIGVHPIKQRRFDRDLMKQTIETILSNQNILNCEVIIYDDFTVETARKYNSDFLIRGIRNNIDYEYEEELSKINENISGLDTVYIRAGNFGNISSSMVMENLKKGKDISSYVPKEILDIILRY